MKIVIYHCYGGSHSSVTAAGIHLGLLPRDRLPANVDLISVPHYDGDERITHGHFRFVGRTRDDQAVLVLGKRTLGGRVTDLLTRVTALSGSGQLIHPVDTVPLINPLMVLGGFISRSLGLMRLGRPIVVTGTKLAYWQLVRQVDLVEEQLRSGPDSLPRQAPVDKSLLLLVTEGRDPLALLTAVFFLSPGITGRKAVELACRTAYSGRVGDLLHLGDSASLSVYLVGGRRGSSIVIRMLKELRLLLQVPQSDLRVSGAAPALPWQLKPLAWLCGRLGLGERRLLARVAPLCRDEALRLRRMDSEGVLD